MNIHQRAQRLAASAIDFELLPREQRELAEHLSACDSCRLFDAAVREDLAALRAISWQPAPAGMREAVSDAVAMSGRIGPVTMPGPMWRPLSGSPFASLVRVAVLLALVAALLGLALLGLVGARRLAVDRSPSAPPMSAGPSAFALALAPIDTTIPVCSGASGLQADANALWFVCGGRIWSADVAAHTSRPIVARTAFSVGPAGLWALDDSAVLEIDPASGAVLARVPHPGGMAIGVGSGAIWVADTSAGTVTRIDPVRGRVSATIKVGPNPIGIAVGANAVWVADQRASGGPGAAADGVARIDPANDTVAARIAVDHGPSPLLFVDGAVWLTDDANGTVSGIDPSTNVVTGIHLDLAVGAEVLPAAAAMDGGWLWVIDTRTGNLVVIAPGPPGGTEPDADPTTARVVDRKVVPGIVPGSASNGPMSMAFLDGVLWISDGAGSLLGIPTQPVP